MRLQVMYIEKKKSISDIDIKFNKEAINSIYLPMLDCENRYLHLYGGAGSGKSVFAAQKYLYRITTEKNHKILLVRKVARTIRNSQFSLLKNLIISSNLKKYFYIREGDLRIICKYNDNEFITTGLDDREKLKSIFGITSIWVEEATELSYADFSQLDLRLRGETENYKQIILTYNPINAHHWLNTKKLKDSVKLKTTYLENEFIDKQYIEVLNGLKNQNEEFYNIYALGEWGVMKNVIYKPFELIKVYPEKFDEIIYGLDFGYNNETALIEIGIKDKIYYLKELIYEKKITNSDLIKRMKSIGVKIGAYIYCDSAETNRIEELRRAGFNAYPSDKNVKSGIDYIKSCKIFSNENNININREVLNYNYKTDKDGNILDEPVKFNDHSMDAIRYAIYTYFMKRQGRGIRVI